MHAAEVVIQVSEVEERIAGGWSGGCVIGHGLTAASYDVSPRTRQELDICVKLLLYAQLEGRPQLV